MDDSQKLPDFTCGPIGGVYALWWGDGPYLCGFGEDQRWLVEILCMELNKKKRSLDFQKKWAKVVE